jgi:hypothetical protein
MTGTHQLFTKRRVLPLQSLVETNELSVANGDFVHRPARRKNTVPEAPKHENQLFIYRKEKRDCLSESKSTMSNPQGAIELVIVDDIKLNSFKRDCVASSLAFRRAFSASKR